MYGEDMWETMFALVHDEIKKSKQKDNLVEFKVFAKKETLQSNSQQVDDVISSAVFAECPMLMEDYSAEKKALIKQSEERMPIFRKKKVTAKQRKMATEEQSDSEEENDSETKCQLKNKVTVQRKRRLKRQVQVKRGK